MGLLSGAISFVRYTVEGELPQNFIDFAAERIGSYAFRDIDDTVDEYSIGWVSIHNMFIGPLEDVSWQAGDSIVMTMRVDERKVSSTVLKKFCRKEEERIKREKQIPKLSRNHRLEIKENMQMMLVKKAVPVPALYDLCWNLADNTVLFFSTNRKAQSVLEDFFKETFGLSIVLQIPYTTAEYLLDRGEQDELARLRPEIFV